MIHYPDYPAEWNPLANDAADAAWQGSPMSMFAKGGRAGCMPFEIKMPKEHVEKMAKGGLASQAKNVADAGVGGDTMVIHINKDEYKKLCQEWGEPTINPHTGMPQFTPFWKQSWFAPVAALATAVAAPYLAPVVGGALGLEAGATFLGANAANVATGALLGAGTGALTGGGKGAVLGGLLGGAAPVAMNAITGPTGLFGSGTTTSTGENVLPSWLGGGETAAPHQAGPEVGVPMPTPRPTGSELAGLGGTEGSSWAQPAAQGSSGIMSTLTKPSVLIPAGILGAMALSGGGGGSQQMPTISSGAPASTDPNLTRRLDTTPLDRTRLAGPIDYYNYGMRPQAKEQRFYSDIGDQAPVQAAHGGPLSHYVQGGGTGRSDSIPAKLSDGEYVVDAETVALLGDGSSKAGAQRLDQFRANIRKQKGKALAQGKFSPDARAPEQYLMGGRA
jgi:hypothetical protein